MSILQLPVVLVYTFVGAQSLVMFESSISLLIYFLFYQLIKGKDVVASTPLTMDLSVCLYFCQFLLNMF